MSTADIIEFALVWLFLAPSNVVIPSPSIGLDVLNLLSVYTKIKNTFSSSVLISGSPITPCQSILLKRLMKIGPSLELLVSGRISYTSDY